eukprot:1187930-Prorocentrum_minimum.AAC.2
MIIIISNPPKASRFPSNEIPRRYFVSVHNLGGLAQRVVGRWTVSLVGSLSTHDKRQGLRRCQVAGPQEMS